MQKSFETLELHSHLLASLDELGYKYMTPIQEQCLSHVLAGRDLIAQAKTGSGKTAVFAIGLLTHIDVNDNRIQGLVLCPTRELADQVANEIRRLAKFIPNVKILSLCGGKPLRPQAISLEYGAHIVVGTPGRIEDHLGKQTIDFRNLKMLVLDEADRMLDMGFNEVISAITQVLPRERQSLLFSATYPDSIRKMSESIQRRPLEIKLASTHSAEAIKQAYFVIKHDEGRTEAAKKLLNYYKPQSAIIFCTTKIQCQSIAGDLQAEGFRALAIHGDLEQFEREEVLVLFANKSCTILVATDLASRGLDIKNLDLVLNYQLARSPEVYIHRIGRTGRADNKGMALSLVASHEKRKIVEIESYQKAPIACEDLEGLPGSSELIHDPIATLKIAGGRKNKISKGDILGALTSKEAGVPGSKIGKIDIFDLYSYVALDEEFCVKALKALTHGKIKGRQIKVKRVF